MCHRTCKLQSIEDALRIYYTRPELTNEDICQLFGNVSTGTLSNLKRPVKERMRAEKYFCCTRFAINTKLAFEEWGIDVAELEARYKKFKKLFGEDAKA